MASQEEVQCNLYYIYAMSFTYAITRSSPSQFHKDLLDKIQEVVNTQPKHEHREMTLEIVTDALPYASGKEYGGQAVVESLLKGFYDAKGYEKIS